MTDQEKAANWLNAWAHVSPKTLAWHMTACLESDGEKVLNESFKVLKIRSAVDLVRAHSD